jgi:beta-glucosidase
MNRNIKHIIKEMTLEEKACLCSGLNFWQTKPVERLNIPSITMTDGPHGVRKQVMVYGALGQMMDSVPATCFPAGATLACSWDRALMRKIGTALGEECQAEDVQILLGPAVNIKRSPLCGRNFEYFSEDPYLSSELAAQHIIGVQSQGVGTSLKHFALNNQETRRNSIDVQVDERAMHEIYLASFEGAIRQAQPWTVMCAYNKVHGEYCSQNNYLLTNVLKEHWAHEGIVVTDWGAIKDRVHGLIAGTELEMPYSGPANDAQIVQAVQSGELTEDVLDQAVERILTILFRCADGKKSNAMYDQTAHHRLARQAAAESAVLLKNDGDILPLSKVGRIAVIGAFAKQPRYQGGGSSHIHPTMLDTALDEMRALAPDAQIEYAQGYSLAHDEVDEALIQEATRIAEQAEVAVLFCGLPEAYESEGYDRDYINMPDSHNALIQAVAIVQPRAVVVLSNGSAVAMPWIDNVSGVLECYLGGQASGSGTADLLFGDAVPCGKLAETLPISLEQTPSFLNFPGGKLEVSYGEGIFVGYRYYEAKQERPLFPFGFGLSYTTFAYTGIHTDKDVYADIENVQVVVTVKNTGKIAAKEIVQLYVRLPESRVVRPVKELKRFEKIFLEPDEEKAVSFTLDYRSFAYYNTEICDWHVEGGRYVLLVGPSSADTPLVLEIDIQQTQPPFRNVDRYTLISDLLKLPETSDIATKLLEQRREALMKIAKMMPEDLRRMFNRMAGEVEHSTVGEGSGIIGNQSEDQVSTLIQECNRLLKLQE